MEQSREAIMVDQTNNTEDELNLNDGNTGIHINDAGYRYVPNNDYCHYSMDISTTVKMEPGAVLNGTYSPSSDTHSMIGPDGLMPGPSPPSSNNGRGRKNKEDKLCGVCGDRALGYNFDAISCESCKAFFRRNAPKGLEYFKCPYDEKCKMDISNRRFCKRCRLKRCFEIGMKKEYILTDQEKARKRQKIEDNRSSQKWANPSDGGRSLLRDLEIYTKVEGEVSSLTNVLSSEDSEIIEDLVNAYKDSLDVPMSEDKPMPRDEASNMIDLVNIAEISIRRVINMAKKVKTFKSLSQADQISLLKGGSIELLIIRSVLTFDKEKQHFLDPVDQEENSAMNIEQLQKAEDGTGLFEDHMKFVKSLAVDLNADQTTLILLLVISLFSPDRPNLINKQLVSEEQERYSMLLKKYLESSYPLVVARSLYPRLLMKLTDIRNLNEDHSQVLLKVNSVGMQPLMQEVLSFS